MHKNEKCAILDEIDEVMYLTTLKDFKLIFMNEKLKNMLKISDDSYVDKNCYEIIHGKTSPCYFCKKINLKKDSFECQKRYISHFDGVFNIKAKKITLNDDEVRLIITDDITELETKNIEIGRKVKVEESILRYVSNLTSQGNIDDAIDKVLAEITNYYQADRGYIFSIDYTVNTLSNTHEYNHENIKPQIDILQNLDLSIISRWIKLFESQGYIYIDSVNVELDPNTDEYKILQEQEIYRLLAHPFYLDGKLIGFIGVDNPKYEFKDITMLKSISFFVFNDLIRHQQNSKLERLSSYDILTGLKNRNRYIYQVETLEENHPDNIGIIYIDLNGLKKVNDVFGHKYGDEKLKRVADIMKLIFPNHSYRIGGDEFVIIITNIEEKEFNNKLNVLLDKFVNDNYVSISIGYVYEENPISIEPLINKADELMYTEKLKYYNKL